MQVKVQLNIINFIGSFLIMDHWTQVIKFSLVFNYDTINFLDNTQVFNMLICQQEILLFSVIISWAFCIIDYNRIP